MDHGVRCTQFLNSERHSMNNDSFSHDGNTQFALSYELLHLLKWLEQHDIEKLKKIISKAVAYGLHDEIQRTSSHVSHNVLEEMHHGIVDFLSLWTPC